MLEEVLSGALTAKYGSKPKIPLPGDDELLYTFAAALLKHLKDKGLYRRDSVAVVPFLEKRRLEPMIPGAFRSWLERHVVCYKVKYDKDGNPFDALRPVPKEMAEAVLQSWDFWPHLPEIQRMHPIPMPKIQEDGTLVMLQPGYDAASKILTFEGIPNQPAQPEQQ